MTDDLHHAVFELVNASSMCIRYQKKLAYSCVSCRTIERHLNEFPKKMRSVSSMKVNFHLKQTCVLCILMWLQQKDKQTVQCVKCEIEPQILQCADHIVWSKVFCSKFNTSCYKANVNKLLCWEIFNISNLLHFLASRNTLSSHYYHYFYLFIDLIESNLPSELSALFKNNKNVMSPMRAHFLANICSLQCLISPACSQKRLDARRSLLKFKQNSKSVE